MQIADLPDVDIILALDLLSFLVTEVFSVGVRTAWRLKSITSVHMKMANALMSLHSVGPLLPPPLKPIYSIIQL